MAQTRQVFAGLSDGRKGKNTSYSMEDFATCALSVFFTQSPSFLAHQQALQQSQGRNNAQSLFQIEQIPCDNQIRDGLDSVAPEEIFPLFDAALQSLQDTGVLEAYRGIGQTIPIALDGTWYHSSEKIHCPNCSCLEHAHGQKTHYHSAITPVIVAPGQARAISLRPEFIVPQDGHEKQDCETAAAKRWLEKNSPRYSSLKATLLGDDLYSRQPMCRQAMLHGFHFLFVCKPESHSTLYKWVHLLEPGIGLREVKLRVKNSKGHWENHLYRYANQVPLVEGEDALKVNWCDVTITNSNGKVLYHNSFVTDWKITDENVPLLAATGRARWKVENENNNVLKNRGYHLEHNFGHGKKHLSSVLAALNLLAFLYHVVLDFCDEKYRLIRQTLVRRQTFFEHVRALTCYFCFADWEALMDFMMRGLELGPHRSKT